MTDRTARPRSAVARLVPRDVLPDRGTPVPDPALCRGARKEVAHLLTELARSYATCDMDRIADAAGRLGEAGGVVGMHDLTRAAGHVAACAGRTDAAALGATVARLIRLGRLAIRRLAG